MKVTESLIRNTVLTVLLLLSGLGLGLFCGVKMGILAATAGALLLFENAILFIIAFRKYKDDFRRQQSYEIKNISLTKQNHDLRSYMSGILSCLKNLHGGSNEEIRDIISTYTKLVGSHHKDIHHEILEHLNRGDILVGEAASLAQVLVEEENRMEGRTPVI